MFQTWDWPRAWLRYCNDFPIAYTLIRHSDIFANQVSDWRIQYMMCREASGHVIIQYLLSMLCDNRKTWFSCLLWKAEYKSFAMRYILYMWMYFCVCMNVLFDHGWVRNHWWFVNQGKVMDVYMRTWNILNTRVSFWQCIEMNPIKISIFCFKFCCYCCCYCCCCFIKLIYFNLIEETLSRNPHVREERTTTLRKWYRSRLSVTSPSWFIAYHPITVLNAP